VDIEGERLRQRLGRAEPSGAQADAAGPDLTTERADAR
jgi:hypothetical protein